MDREFPEREGFVSDFQKRKRKKKKDFKDIDGSLTWTVSCVNVIDPKVIELSLTSFSLFLDSCIDLSENSVC